MVTLSKHPYSRGPTRQYQHGNETCSNWSQKGRVSWAQFERGPCKSDLHFSKSLHSLSEGEEADF